MASVAVRVPAFTTLQHYFYVCATAALEQINFELLLQARECDEGSAWVAVACTPNYPKPSGLTSTKLRLSEQSCSLSVYGRAWVSDCRHRPWL
jgi:hypothetical protein